MVIIEGNGDGFDLKNGGREFDETKENYEGDKYENYGCEREE